MPSFFVSPFIPLNFRRLAEATVLVGALAVGLANPEAAGIDFNRDIRPVLSENCFQCHGPDEEQRKVNLRLDDLTEALAKGDSGRPAIVPGEPEKSEFLRILRVLDNHASKVARSADTMDDG